MGRYLSCLRSTAGLLLSAVLYWAASLASGFASFEIRHSTSWPGPEDSLASAFLVGNRNRRGKRRRDHNQLALSVYLGIAKRGHPCWACPLRKEGERAKAISRRFRFDTGGSFLFIFFFSKARQFVVSVALCCSHRLPNLVWIWAGGVFISFNEILDVMRY